MKIAMFFLKLCVTGTVLYFALRQVSIEEYQQAFSLLTPLTFLFLVSTVLLQVFVLGCRWRYLMALTAKAKMSLMGSFVGIMMSFFFSQGLPASIGGDAFRVWWMAKRGISTNSAMKIVFFDRIYGLIALTLACAGSVIYLLIFEETGSPIWPLAILILLMGSVLWLLIMPFRLGVTQFFAKKVERFPLVLRKVVHWIAEVRDSLSRHPSSHSLILVGTSFFIHCLVIVQAFVIGHRLSPDKLSFLICLFAVPPALFVSYMPFSIAGWGVREASMVVAFGLFGIPAATALTVSLMIGMSVLATSLLGGIFWLTGYRKAHAKDLAQINLERA